MITEYCKDLNLNPSDYKLKDYDRSITNTRLSYTHKDYYKKDMLKDPCFITELTVYDRELRKEVTTVTLHYFNEAGKQLTIDYSYINN